MFSFHLLLASSLNTLIYLANTNFENMCEWYTFLNIISLQSELGIIWNYEMS